MRKNTDRIAEWILDNASVLRIALKTDDKGNAEILRVDPDKLTPLYTCDVFESCAPAHFDHANQKVHMITNKGANVDLIELFVLEPARGKASRLKDDPLKRVHLQDAMSSQVDNRLLATIYDDYKQRVYWKDKSYEADYNWLKSKLPGREIGFTSHRSDENVWVISATATSSPARFTFLIARRRSYRCSIECETKSRVDHSPKRN